MNTAALQQKKEAALLCERLRNMELGPCNDAADFIERNCATPQDRLEEAWQAVGAIGALGETCNDTVFKCMDAIRALQGQQAAHSDFKGKK